MSGRDLGPRRHVVWITNVAAPYRRPVWEALGESVDLCVLLLENHRRFLKSGTNRGREWMEYTGGSYTITELPTARVRRGENAYYIAKRIRFLDDYRPNAVVLTGWESPAYWAALRWCKRKNVHTVGFYESTLATQHHRGGPIAAVRRRFFLSLDRVVVPGLAAREALLSAGVDDGRIDVGFNAVDVEDIHARTQAVRGTHRIGMRGPGHRFLYIGQLIERKNVRSLIEAFGRVATADDTLTIVGTGALERQLRQQAFELSVEAQIAFSGLVPYAQLPQLFAAHDTLVLPSAEEVWGLVVNEALAAGLHAVVTEVAGVARSVGDMPAVYLSEVSVDSIARAMTDSREDWRGPSLRHPILEMTPRRFADVFARSLGVLGE